MGGGPEAVQSDLPWCPDLSFPVGRAELLRKCWGLVFSPGGKEVGTWRLNHGVLGVHGHTPRQVTVMSTGGCLIVFQSYNSFIYI